MYKTSVQPLLMDLFVAGLLAFGVVHAVTCNGFGQPETNSHVERSEGKCYEWAQDDESHYECCVFCRNFFVDTIASQMVPPGGRDPFMNMLLNSEYCCCHIGGEIKDGGDGTEYWY